MVAVTKAVSASEVTPVAIVAGDEASGLANIIGQYLEQLLTESPEKRAEAAALRGRLGLRAREGDVAVTIVFAEDAIRIEEELQEPDAIIGGEVEALMHVLAGRANPAWELRRGTFSVRPNLRHPLFGYQAYCLMRLPGVHLWSGLPRPPLALVAGAGVAVGALLVARRLQRRTRGGDNG